MEDICESIESKNLSLVSSDMHTLEEYHEMKTVQYQKCKQKKQKKRLERNMNTLRDSSKRFEYEYKLS